jgi:hypothetical protein
MIPTVTSTMPSHRRDRDSHDRAERRRDRSDSPDRRRRYSSSRMDDLDLYQEKQIRPRDDTRRGRHESERRRSSHKDVRHRSERHHRDEKDRKRSKRDKGTPSDDEDLLDIRALGISPITEEDY